MGKPKRSNAQPVDDAPVDGHIVTAADAILAKRVNERVFSPEESPAFDEARQALNRIEKRNNLSRTERLALREALVYDAMGAAAAPDKAPELWSDRRGTKENPVSFVRRVYGPWLGRGLRRSHFFSLDRPLYTALQVWLHRHPEIGFPELEP